MVVCQIWGAWLNIWCIQFVRTIEVTMKNLAIFLILLLPISAGSLSLTLKSEHVPQENAWKYGVETVRKSVGEDEYLGIYINEKLLCPIKSIYFSRVKGDTGTVEELGYDAGTYHIKTQFIGFQTAHVTVRCREGSKVHGGVLFTIEVWRHGI